MSAEINPMEFTHPQQVRNFLADTIGEEVFNEMEGQDPSRNVGNVFRKPAPSVAAPVQEGQQADPAAQPAAPAAPADSPASKPEGQPGGEGKLLLGKYKSESDAEKAYHGLIHSNKALLAERDQLLANLSEFQNRANGQQPAPSAAPSRQADPVSRSEQRASILKELENDPLNPEIITKLTDLAVNEALERATAPQRAVEQADQYMTARYPEAYQFVDEVQQFVATDPATRAAVKELWDKGAHGPASELAYLKWQLHKASSAETGAIANAEVRRQEVEKARVDAGLVSSQASGVHESSSANLGPTKEDMESAIKQYHSGYKKPLLNIIGADLPDEMFGIQR